MYITLDGTRYYAYTGTHAPDPDLETVVFVHGASMDHTVWSHQSRYFSYHGFNVLALDLPGHRLSQGALLSRVEDMAEWLIGILAATSARDVHLVGHSMGSLVALEAAANLDQGVSTLKTLSLIGFCYPMSVAPVLMDAARDNPSKAYSMMTQWSHASKTGGEPVPGFWSAGMQMSMMENSPEGSIYCNLQACHNYAGGKEAFERITCPILFVSGKLDKMSPARIAMKEAQRNENASIELLPGCGHNIMFESPDGVLNSLKGLIDA
ncbi:MAG: alpha/beta hydrolase [Gammaproteobacteria bacterium]|nr:alpha/beta hydrolase [Gammaproteobacteria bacterium]MYD76177.1 alpha/beta hydrolase [Gammaproteobacteria bacterium]MYJ53148.1 alpha/beta hydrolase [Gammaproteobacteria bacterium]